MAAVTGEQVQELLAANSSGAAPVVPIITAMAKAYTRGRGFTDGAGGDEPNEEIAAVILTASARLLANTRQTSGSDTAGDFGRDVRSFFTGWTLAEQIVLNRYRVTAR